jgi:hypothetical protein
MDAQENNVPIAIFSIGALLRECTLQRSTLLVPYLDARPYILIYCLKPQLHPTKLKVL